LIDGRDLGVAPVVFGGLLKQGSVLSLRLGCADLLTGTVILRLQPAGSLYVSDL